MKLGVNLVLVFIILVLAYTLYNSFQEPIQFQEVLQERKTAVINKLKEIRTAQKYYEAIHHRYAGNFDALKDALQLDSFMHVKIYAVGGDSSVGEYVYDTTYVAAADSLMQFQWYAELDSIEYVPYSISDTFQMSAGTITYQHTQVNVVEVKTRYKTFMGKYADEKYKRYQKSYEPMKFIKFGDMTSPTLDGNW